MAITIPPLQIMKMLTQVVTAKIITQHGRGWNFTVNSKDIHYSFSWSTEKLITSRDDHPDWMFYQLWSNGSPGPRYACKADQGKLVKVLFEEWDPHGGFRTEKYTSGGGGHNVMVLLTDDEHELARKYPGHVRLPSHESIMLELLAKMRAE